MNCATSAAGPAENRPLRETGELFLARFTRRKFAGTRAESHVRRGSEFQWFMLNATPLAAQADTDKPLAHPDRSKNSDRKRG